MASLEPSSRQRYVLPSDESIRCADILSSRDALPPINNFDFDKYRMEKVEHSRFSLPNLNTISKGTLGSPPTSYTGPPPPYSSAASANNSGQSMSGYISPPESSSRRSTRDEKESPKSTTLLPSISEALQSTDMANPTQSFAPNSAPGPAVGQVFGEAPKGPGNPFSQPAAPASALRPSVSSMPDPSSIKTVPPPPAPSDTRQPPIISTLGSPRSNGALHRLSGPMPPTNAPSETTFRSSFSTQSARPGYPFPDYHTQQNPLPPPSLNAFSFEHQTKIDEPRTPFVKPESRPYNETVKRHLDVYDAELALNDVRCLPVAITHITNILIDCGSFSTYHGLRQSMESTVPPVQSHKLLHRRPPKHYRS